MAETRNTEPVESWFTLPEEDGPEPCSACDGTGIGADERKCKECDGKGHLQD